MVIASIKISSLINNINDRVINISNYLSVYLSLCFSLSIRLSLPSIYLSLSQCSGDGTFLTGYRLRLPLKQAWLSALWSRFYKQNYRLRLEKSRLMGAVIRDFFTSIYLYHLSIYPSIHIYPYILYLAISI